MRYEIEADWLLLLTCNFRCSYCFIDPRDLGSKVRRAGTPQQWRDGFARTGKTWLLHLTGGEPLVHPDFLEIVSLLSQDHYLSLNSNLSHGCIEALAQVVRPDRVHFINASLHWDERARKGGLTDFVRRVQLLQSAGFRVMVSQVADPALLPRLEGVMIQMAELGITVFPKAMRGPYLGKEFPAAYSEVERILLKRLIAHARTAAGALRDALGEAPTIDLFLEERRLEERSYRGRWCAAGPRFVRLDGFGRVMRCGSNISYGSILAGNASLPPDIHRCRTSYCPYYCDKYSVPMSTLQEMGAARKALLPRT